MREALRQALERAVAESNAPGGVACVGDVRRVFFLAATGLRQVAPESLPAQKD
ncbi:MAG: hypothetical protein QG656_113, partial [Candidatus Hydrogenedentes bacterium]|nr:hypothetical protein [Candidatus Hydrogenedentota bacterium]